MSDPKDKRVDNPYEVLEVSARARPEVIEAAYKALLKRYQLSGKPGDEEVVKIIKEAHKLLKDPAKKSEFDSKRGDLKGKVIGAYRITERIAEGGFGKTYKGEHVILGEPVCLKHCSEITPQTEQILLDEARAMWDLRHYGIPSVRDVIKLEDGSVFLVSSYIPGPTLEKIIEKSGCLDPEHVLWITERVLNILKYLHFHGVVHGDIKPQNIIVQPESHMAVLVDFGLSLIKPKSDTSSKGHTDYFAPPEEIAGKPLVPESDFYSLGMTMIYALGGSYDNVKDMNIPKDTPDAICEFILNLIRREVLSRPNWEKEDLCEKIVELRKKVFGRGRSGMKRIPGF